MAQGSSLCVVPSDVTRGKGHKMKHRNT